MWITYWIFLFSLSAVRLCHRHNTDWKEKRKTLENFMLYGAVIDVVKGNEKTKAEHPNSFRFLREHMWCENEEKGKPADNSVFFNPVHVWSSRLICGDISSLCEPVQTQKHDEAATYEIWKCTFHTKIFSYCIAVIEHTGTQAKPMTLRWRQHIVQQSPGQVMTNILHINKNKPFIFYILYIVGNKAQNELLGRHKTNKVTMYSIKLNDEPVGR